MTSSFSMTPKVSNQGTPKLLIPCVDSSRGDPARASRPRNDSTLCGEHPTTIGESPSGKLIVTRLCTETPTAGGRVFETGDEDLLRLAYKTNSASPTITPVLRLRYADIGDHRHWQLLS